MFPRRLAAIVLFAFPSISLAWGPEGHQIVALIAYAHLTPEAKAATKKILGEGKDIYDGEIANWADVIRRDNKDLGPYHYVDADVSKRAIDLRNDGNGGINVVDGLTNQLAYLSGDTTARQITVNGDDSATDDKKETPGQALRWVVHLAGDIAQPLHTCDRNQDQGGNKVPVQIVGVEKPSNLHALYDSGLLRQYVNTYYQTHRRKPTNNKDDNDVLDITDYAMSIDAKIRPADVKAWSAGTPLDWANDSHMVAVKEIYADVPRGTPAMIDQRYVSRKQLLVERQLAKGGIRLAAALNKAFAAPAPTSRPTR